MKKDLNEDEIYEMLHDGCIEYMGLHLEHNETVDDHVINAFLVGMCMGLEEGGYDRKVIFSAFTRARDNIENAILSYLSEQKS